MQRNKLAAAALAAALAGTAFATPASAGGNPMPNESQVPETTFLVTIQNISDGFELSGSGPFTNPDGGDEAGPAFPGSSYSFDVYGHPGDRLSLATMLVQSNDWFFSPGDHGIALYDDDGNPISGDITSHFYVIDAGTEVDQTPGEGADQAPRQSGPDTGAADPDHTVRVVASAPAVSDLIKVTAHPGDNGHFSIVVENVSGDSTLPGPLAPGVFAVHQDGAPLFTLGEPDRGEGLESLAEDGGPGDLAHVLDSRTGIATPLAPGVYASNRGAHRNPFYYFGRADWDNGLEELAEDGNPAVLAEWLSGQVRGDSGAFTTPVGGDGPAPLFPGESYQFEVTSRPGDTVAVATMFVQSNDWFFGTNEWGLNLFRRGRPLNGNITYNFALFDAGTEADQAPGFGPDQAPRQSGPDTGADDPNDRVRLVQRDVSRYIKVTVKPIS